MNSWRRMICPSKEPSPVYGTQACPSPPTDVLATHGAKPSASTVLTEKSDMFSSKYPYEILHRLYGLDDVIKKNDRKDLMKSRCTSSVNSSWPSDAMWRHKSWSLLVQVMTCRLFGTKPLPETKLTYCHIVFGANSGEISFEIQQFISRKCIWKCCMQNVGHFVRACVLIHERPQRTLFRDSRRMWD